MTILSILFGILFFGFGIAICNGCWAGDFDTKDAAQIVGAVLMVSGPILICLKAKD